MCVIIILSCLGFIKELWGNAVLLLSQDKADLLVAQKPQTPASVYEGAANRRSFCSMQPKESGFKVGGDETVFLK